MPIWQWKTINIYPRLGIYYVWINLCKKKTGIFNLLSVKNSIFPRQYPQRIFRRKVVSFILKCLINNTFYPMRMNP